VIASITDSQSSDVSCTSGVGDDGDGALSLGYMANTLIPPVPRHVFFQIQKGSAVRVGGMVSGGDEGGQLTFSQPSGFSVFDVFGQTQASVLETWSHDGVFVSRSVIAGGTLDLAHTQSSAVGVDPSGGTATAKNFFSNAHGWTTFYQRFDKTGAAETGLVQVDSAERRVGSVGVPLSGHALVLSSVGSPNWEGRWLARDGSPISSSFTLQGQGFPRFQFLVDGSLALGFAPDFSEPATAFAYRIEDGAAVAGPLPAWLQPRAGNQLYVVRSGKAYATWGGGGRCGSQLELLATSGKSCGCVNVPGLTRSASVGRDGTLLVPGPSSSATCTYDLYPKLLR
jgi:hypothetical protein